MKENQIEYNKRKYLYIVFCIFLIILLLVPFFWALYYVLPAADDFSFSGDIQKLGGHNIGGAFKMVKDNYFSWQGSYFGLFLVGIVDPLRRSGVKGISTFLIIIFILFITIIFSIVYIFNRKTYRKSNFVLFVTSILVTAGCLNVRLPKEIFFWYTGACTYLVPLLCGFVGLICLEKYYQSKEENVKSKSLLIISAFLGSLASGGILQVTGFICWLYLLFFLYAFYKKRKLLKIGGIFLVVLGGALINALAPGNFARQEMSYEKISFLKAIYYTIITIINELKYIFSVTYIPWLLIIFIILAFLYHKPIKEKLYHPMLVGVAVILSWFISTFPVCLGYGSSTMEQRGYTILDIYMILGMFLILNSIVNYIKLYKKINLTGEGIIIISIFSVVTIGYFQPQIPISNIPSLLCLRQLISGEAQQFNREWTEILKEIEDTEGSEVNLTIKDNLFDKDIIYLFPEISENPEKWINDAVAKYYGKERLNININKQEE